MNLWVTSLSRVARRQIRGLFEDAGLGPLAEAVSTAALQQALAVATRSSDVVVTGIEWSDARPFVRAAQAGEAPVLVLVRPHESVADHPAVAAGADAILHADTSPSALHAAVNAVCAGLHAFELREDEPLRLGEGRAGVRRAQPDAGERERRREVRPLTAREREILELVAAGTSNKQIARALRVSPNTVKFHLASLFDKLGATTRAEAVAVGIRRGELVL